MRNKVSPFEIGYYAVWGLFWFLVLAGVGIIRDLPTAALYWATFVWGLVVTRLILGNPFAPRDGKGDDPDDLW